jgi:hypothetical protein
VYNLFQQRQFQEVWPLVEISYTTSTVSPGGVTSATPVAVTAACSVGAVGGGTSAATFALGDNIEVFPPAGAATNGLQVIGSPTATPGTVEICFINYTGATITPTAGTYKIIARRQAANIIA